MTGKEYIKKELARGKKLCRDGWKWAKDNGLLDKPVSEAWNVALEQGVKHLIWIADGAIQNPVERAKISWRMWGQSYPVSQDKVREYFDGIENPFKEGRDGRTADI